MGQAYLEINGRKVFSNKPGVNIEGDIVKFSDGSWCNVRTGQVFNNGPGYISLDVDLSPEQSSETITQSSSFAALPVKVANVNAQVDIQVHNENNIIVDLTGPADELKEISMKEIAGKLVIAGHPNSGRTGFSQTNIFSNNVMFSNVSMSSKASEPKVYITIKVPVGTDLDLSGIAGKTIVGDTFGNLSASLQGVSILQAGKVKNASIELSGAAKAEISRISGAKTTFDLSGASSLIVEALDVSRIDIDTSGSAQCQIKSGKTHDISIHASGSSLLNLLIEAINGVFRASGAARISINRVTGDADRKTSGAASVTIVKR